MLLLGIIIHDDVLWRNQKKIWSKSKVSHWLSTPKVCFHLTLPWNRVGPLIIQLQLVSLKQMLKGKWRGTRVVEGIWEEVGL